nr:hypothetical protein [Tanacetum cinerariifolium]
MFNEPLLLRVNTLGSGEECLKLQELMVFSINCLHRLLVVKMKNRQSDMVRKRNERISELKNTKRDVGLNNRQSVMATMNVTRVNDQAQIQALVDKHKVIIMEDSIKSNLCFNVAEGTACLPNEETFEGLTRMG